MENPIVNDIEFLRKKAASLPASPGVYIMEDREGKVIYVGKSRSLKNRVSQYFHGSHDIKTSRMASSVNNFRFIVCNTEMDALILENDLIKQYTPRYNILLKDSKSYPYIKITNGEYPRIVMTRKRQDDGRYFGPYSGSAVIYDVIAMLERALGIPSCKHSFPKEIGKIRPCVYRQIGRCCGVCAGDVSPEKYKKIIDSAVNILNGNTTEAIRDLEGRMFEAAAEEKYEEAASCRDGIAALKKISERRRVTDLAPGSEYDVIATAEFNGAKCAAVFYVRDGIISDSEQFIFGADEITGYITKNEVDGVAVGIFDDAEDFSGDYPLSSFITNLYSGREYIPSEVLLSFDMPEGEKELLGEYLSTKCAHRVTFKTPKRGELRHLCVMAENDATRHAESRKKRSDATKKVLESLSQMIGTEKIPERIECYDISNLGDEFITAGMIVSKNGVFKKSDYRYFRIKNTDTADDYASMCEALERRFSHINDDDKSFSEIPDLILLDGGQGHVNAVTATLNRLGISVPVFGMVKDSHHKTRTLVSGTEEISIARDISVFRFVFALQEEVHRFTIDRMKAAKLKSLKTSSLEKINGIGEKKAKALLMELGGLEAIKEADFEKLCSVTGINKTDAENIIEYFKNEKG